MLEASEREVVQGSIEGCRCRVSESVCTVCEKGCRVEASEREVVQGSIEGCSCKLTPLERRADVADLSADL